MSSRGILSGVECWSTWSTSHGRQTHLFLVLATTTLSARIASAEWCVHQLVSSPKIKYVFQKTLLTLDAPSIYSFFFLSIIAPGLLSSSLAPQSCSIYDDGTAHTFARLLLTPDPAQRFLFARVGGDKQSAKTRRKKTHVFLEGLFFSYFSLPLFLNSPIHPDRDDQLRLLQFSQYSQRETTWWRKRGW